MTTSGKPIAPGSRTASQGPQARRMLQAAWTVMRLSFYLGWQDVRLMYRRSVLGQFWITLSMAITFVAIGAVFGLIFRVPVLEYLPFLGCGLIFFTFLSSILNEGSQAFIAANPFIQQLSLPPVTFYLRTIWKTMFILLHNAVALAVLLMIFPPGFSFATLLVVPGVLLGGLAMAGLGLALAMLATRYRDIPQIIAAVVQVFFYLTPIVWLPTALPEAARDIILRWNPFFHLIQVMRQPVLNAYPTAKEWLIALSITVVFVTMGAAAYVWKRKKLAFWL